METDQSVNLCAQWVWLPEVKTQHQTTLQIRHVFELSGSCNTARLLVSANHIYAVWLNGVFVGRGPDRADPRYLYFDAYEVGKELVSGKNVLCVLVHHFQITGREWCLYDGAPGLLVQLEADGKVLAASSGDWRGRPAPGWRDAGEHINQFRPYRHEFDCRACADLSAPLRVDYAMDNAWQPLSPMPFAPAGPLPQPRPREIPFLQPVIQSPCKVEIAMPHHAVVMGYRELCGRPETLPATINPAAEGALIRVEFTRPMGGFPRLMLEAEGSGMLDIYCGEGDTAFLTDRLLLAPGTDIAYQPLDWRGGQYLLLGFHDLAAPVRLRGVDFVEMIYPFKERGAFSCADAELSKIWAISRTTAWAGVKDHLVDCLNREQALWAADVYVHVRAIAACFGDMRPAVKAVRQILRVMDENGVVPVPGPAGLGYKTDGELLNWGEMSLSLPLAMAAIQESVSDSDLLKWSLPLLEKLMAHFRCYEDERGLLATARPGLPRLKCFGGWNPMLKEGVTCALNSEYIMAMRALSVLYRRAGQSDRAAQWLDRAARSVASARQAFWVPERALFADGLDEQGRALQQFSPTANAWAALAGLLPPEQAGSWAEALRLAPDIMPPQTPFDATLLLEAFLRYQLDLHARALLHEYFGAIARAGLPTLPEFWHSGHRGGLQFRGPASSLCHPFGAGPAFLLPRCLFGIHPVEDNWQRIKIGPRTLGLVWAQGRVPTPLGEVEIAWQKSETRWELELHLPADMAAEIVLPRLGWGRERLLVNNELIWQSDGRGDYAAQLKRAYFNHKPREIAAQLPVGMRGRVVLESF